MAEIEEDKFDELCRLCASYDAVQMDIFGEKGRERKIIEKIHTCLPFQVKERDLLPKSICYRCMYNLENFFDFRKGCVDAVTKLEKFVEKSKRNKQFVNGECMTSITTDEEDEPNPADFLEACLAGESVGNGVQTDIREMPPTIVVDLDCLPQRVATPPDDFTCQTCGRTFNSRGALTQHSKYHTGESDQTQVYTCHVCEKAFSSKGHLASHSKVHIGDLADRPTPLIPTPSDIGALRPFKCDLCEKSYSMAKHLWGHVSVSHKGDPKVTCHYCSRTFSTIANLEDHKKYKHNLELEIKAEKVDVKVEARDDEDIVKVEENNSSQSIVEEQGGSRRKSSKPRKIKREVVNHDEIDMKDEPLDLATTSSTAAVTEEESSRSETTDKSISCPFCEGVFPSRTILNQHLLDKHEVNPEDITNSPPHHEDMKMAENMLEAETVFCCEICVRDFNDRASLWLHMLYSHREEAATACGICLRVCSDNVSLMEHVYSCHPKDSLTADQKRYSCQICGRQLDSKKKLLTHVRIHNLYDDTGQTLDPESVIVLNNKNRPIPPPTTNSQPKENNQFEMQHEVFTEEGQLIMSCEICYKVFPNEEKLVKHKQNAHRNSQGPNSINSSTTYFLYFSCELCGLAHSTRTERWRHMFSCHADEPTLLCDQEKCGKVFPTRALRTEHVTTHHSLQGDTPNTCEICGKLWATRVNYWKHMMSVHADCLPFICGVCLKIFCTVPDLSAHVRERHWPLAGSDYCCDICGRPYPNKSKMFRHRKLHVIPEAEGGLPAGHELEDIPPANESRPSLEVFDQQLTCSLCPDQEFLCLEDLSKHRKTAHNLVPCDLCPKFYGRSSHLWKHVNKIHKNHPDITCSVCFRTSASRNHLANHIAKHHRHEVLCQNYIDICELSNEEAVHNCVKCNKVFRKHLLLKKHMRHCTGPPNQIATGPSPCERCSKVFDSPIQLRKHLRNSHLHFKCELCEDVAHDSRIELMNHIKEAHAGDPSLTCDYKGCGMMLRCKSDVAKHRKEHRQGRPPPTCSFCGELTPNKMKLRNHLKSQHPLLTKHLCSICLVTMKDFDELRKHVRSKHKSSLGKTNICPICVRSYSNKSKVLVHIRSHGEGFFPCEICVKVFRDPEKHKRHTDAHFDENSEELEAEEEEEEEEEDAANQEEQEEEEGDCEDEEETVGEEKEKSVKKNKTSEQDNEEEDEEEEEEEGDGDEEDEETKTEDVESVITKRTSDDEDADEKDDVSSSQIEIEDDDTNETVPVKRQRRTHPCIACSKTFTNSTSFLRHMKADHVELICACGKMSENIQSHNNHLKKCITGKKKESAKVEDKKTPTLNRKSLEKKFLNSDSKGMTNTTATPTLKDNNKSSTDKPATTTTTPAVNTSNSSSKREVRRVYKSDDGLCSCELCKKHFEAKRHLWQHLRRFHLKEAATSCGVCLKVCKDYESLDSHLAIEHKNNFEGEGKNFTCRVCGRYHNSRSKLEQHSVIHPGQEIRTHAALHSCRWCPLAFNSATSLAVHQSTDHKDKSGDEKMEVDVPDHDEDSRSSTSSSSSANSSCSSSSGSSSSSSASSSSGSSSSTSSSSGSSSSSSNSSEEGGRKDSKDSTKAKDSKVSKLSPLLKQAQRRPEKTAWSSIHKVAVSRSSERNRNNFKTSSPITNKLPNKPNDTLSGNDNCVDNDEDEDVIVLSDENNAGAFNNSEAKFVEDNVNLSEDSSASSAEEEDQDEDDEAVRSVADLEKDMSATAKV